MKLIAVIHSYQAHTAIKYEISNLVCLVRNLGLPHGGQTCYLLRHRYTHYLKGRMGL